MQRQYELRLAPLFLAVMFFMNCMGIFMLAFIQTGLHRMAERLHDEQQIRQLEMSISEFRNIAWTGDRDFVYHENVYDLSSVSIKGDKVIVNCTSDNEETTITKNVASGLDNGKPNGTPSSMKDIFKVIQTAEADQHLQLSFSSSFSDLSYGEPLFSLSSSIHSLNTPPPQAA